MKLQFLIISFFVVLCSATDDTITERPCNIAFKCSLEEDPVWVTDGKKCYVFRNACLLANENCQRQNRYDSVLEVISKEKCQTLCSPRCPKNKNPVCGYYKDVKREFPNHCLMDYHICNTGETYMIYNEGPCLDPLNL